ncbi:MAG: hypothetical protein HQL06_08580 [Nitrospirae bacterium]|nr:hypothetical protein [Nitrospirota bacterium]
MQKKRIFDEANNPVVRQSDLAEIKSMFAELLAWQRSADQKFTEITQSLKSTNERIDTTNAEVRQLRTELNTRIDTTNAEVRQVRKEMKLTRSELGGISKSMSYALENEAYRLLPKLLKDKYNIEVTDRFVRVEIQGEEINIFAKALKDGKPVLIVGEAKLRLQVKTGRGQTGDDVFKQLTNKIKAAMTEYTDMEVVSLLVTHYVTANFLKKAAENEIIVVQSFQW